MNFFEKLAALFRRGTAPRKLSRIGRRNFGGGVNTDGMPMVGRIDMCGRFYGTGRKRLF